MCIKRAWFNLHQISKIKGCLSQDQLKPVIHAFVMSKLDYNNGLLGGSSKQLKSTLQSVQNVAAKLIYGIKKYDRISPPLAVLHWLPVEEGIDFKIILLVYKCLQGKCSIYLCELLMPYQPQGNLRSQHKMLLVIPTSGNKTLETYEKKVF